MLSIKTSFGSTIYDCAKSALENPDSNVGLYAPGKNIFKHPLLIYPVSIFLKSEKNINFESLSY
jgi:hypothetical protein